MDRRTCKQIRTQGDCDPERCHLWISNNCKNEKVSADHLRTYREIHWHPPSSIHYEKGCDIC